MTRRRRAPALESCPTCGLPIEAGSNAQGRAWHDCEFVTRLTEDVSVESVLRLLLLRIRDAASSANPRELVGLLAALKEATPAKPAGEESSDEGSLGRWLGGGAPRPW